MMQKTMREKKDVLPPSRLLNKYTQNLELLLL